MINISLKGLAKYMVSSPTTQRKVLRDYKFPDEEGLAQATYYREARDRIVAYHRGKYQAAWLQTEASGLDVLAANSSGKSKPRLRNNASALREYAAHWGGRRIEPLADVKMVLEYGAVRVKVVPDLHMREGGRSRLVKFEFARTAPDKRVVSIITQAMFEAALARNLGMKAVDILYFDVPRGRVHKGARIGSRMARDIESTCRNIEGIWPTI